MPQPRSSFSYDEIVEICRKRNILYQDREFPAEERSITLSGKKISPHPVEWKRPSEIVSSPQWIERGVSQRLQVEQNLGGDDGLLAAVISMSAFDNFFSQVLIQREPSFTENYCGAFKFMIWFEGDFKEVVVDDRLPTAQGALLFARSPNKNVFWIALLEKAFAKLYGSYEALKGISAEEAMMCFIGGLSEEIDLDKASPRLFKLMEKRIARQSLMTCCVKKPQEGEDKALPSGLYAGESYSITGLHEVECQTRSGPQEVELIRIRSTYGQSYGWNGAWADRMSEWSLLSDTEKKKMDLNFEDDGEFWMSFEDFLKNFDRVDMCHVSASFYDERGVALPNYEEKQERGEWIKGLSAGGSPKEIDTFHLNPQFKISLAKSDDTDKDGLCTTIISLVQQAPMEKRNIIAFGIYKIQDESVDMDKSYFMNNKSVANSGSVTQDAILTRQFKLEPGTYCIIPSTYEPDKEGRFLLRIFTEKPLRHLPAAATYIQEEEPTMDELQRNTLRQRFENFFKSVAGADKEIDAFELKQVLDKADKSGLTYGIDVCRSMIAIYDSDSYGGLTLDDFINLFTNIKKWMTTFSIYDRDHNGSLDVAELRNAMNKAGISLSNKSLDSATKRYKNKAGRVSCPDFIACIVRLKAMIKTFKEHERTRGQATFSLDDFINDVFLKV